MSVDPIEDLRERKVEEIRKEQEMQHQIASVEQSLKQRFTKQALERYNNIKIAYPDKALKLMEVLVRIIGSSRTDMIDDATLRGYLERMEAKKDLRIIRK